MRMSQASPWAHVALTRILLVVFVVASHEGDLERFFGQGAIWALVAIIAAVAVVVLSRHR